MKKTSRVWGGLFMPSKNKIAMIVPFIILTCMAFICCGNGADNDDGENPPIDYHNQTVPQGAQWRSENINRGTLPSGYTAVVGFALAVTLDPLSHEQALVEVEYMRLIEKNLITAEEKILVAEEYNDGPGVLDAHDGGLYLRMPKWFPPGDVHTPVTNAEVNDGLLTIDVAKTPDRIAHWWTNRAPAKPDCRYYVEMRVRVTGQAALQLGSDWWRDLSIGYNHYDASCETSNNCKAWASDWIVDTGGSFIVLKVPVG